MTDATAPTRRRKVALDAFKRDLIRAAAREVFVAKGLAQTTLREIARAAGSTTGAIYAQYASKEEVYADILRQSLADLHGDMAGAVQSGNATGERAARTRQALRALFLYYSDRTAEFELGFYLKSGAARIGLGRELDEELNCALKAIFDLVAQALVEDGLYEPAAAQRQSVLLVTSVFGLLLMDKTGRLAMLQQDAAALLEAQISAL